MNPDDARRLELIGFASWRAADELREVRHRFPVLKVEEDALARQAVELEELARTVAGECAARLRDARDEEVRRGAA